MIFFRQKLYSNKLPCKLARGMFVFALVFAWAFLPVADYLTFEIGGQKITLAPKNQEAGIELIKT